MNCFLHLWRVQKKEYKIHTNDYKLAAKLRNRKDVIQYAYGVNCQYWGFTTHYSRPVWAMKSMMTLSGIKPAGKPRDGEWKVTYQREEQRKQKTPEKVQQTAFDVLAAQGHEKNKKTAQTAASDKKTAKKCSTTDLSKTALTEGASNA
jgi:hypothetical protein